MTDLIPGSSQRSLESLIEERTDDLRRLAAEVSLAEARERRELASDLHDHIIQQFAFIRLRIQQFRGDAIFCGFEQSFEEIVKLLDKAIHQARVLTFEISSPILYDLGLPAALERLTEWQTEQHKIPISFKLKGKNVDLPEAVRVTLYKCVQELLVNAVKYSQADTISIDMVQSRERIEIKVFDSGVGFDPGRIAKPGEVSGFGLFSIRERMRYFGGSMSLNSATGSGTVVTLDLPLENWSKPNKF